MSNNYLKKIAIVGAGGQFGTFITKALVKEGKLEVTAITRANSDAKIPDGVHHIKNVDYDSPSSLAEGLKGQDALIITMRSMTPGNPQHKLIDAAKAAGVQWVMPNEYGYDVADNHQFGKEFKLGDAYLAVRKYIEDASLNWISMSCGFWYEFSLAGSESRYGFDFDNKKLTLFDDGNTKIPTSTWPQAALGVARTFALPVEAVEGKAKTLSLSQLKNRAVFIYSFYVSQRDMLASVLRVSGEKESDWTITSEPANERWERGGKMLEGGSLEGFAILLYTRIFFKDGASDYTAKSNNEDLNLPEENFDDATRVGLGLVDKLKGRFERKQ